MYLRNNPDCEPYTGQDQAPGMNPTTKPAPTGNLRRSSSREHKQRPRAPGFVDSSLPEAFLLKSGKSHSKTRTEKKSPPAHYNPAVEAARPQRQPQSRRTTDASSLLLAGTRCRVLCEPDPTPCLQWISKGEIYLPEPATDRLFKGTPEGYFGRPAQTLFPFESSEPDEPPPPLDLQKVKPKPRSDLRAAHAKAAADIWGEHAPKVQAPADDAATMTLSNDRLENLFRENIESRSAQAETICECENESDKNCVTCCLSDLSDLEEFRRCLHENPENALHTGSECTEPSGPDEGADARPLSPWARSIVFRYYCKRLNEPEKILNVINSNAELKQESRFDMRDLQAFCRETDFSELNRIRELSPRKHRSRLSLDDGPLEPPPETSVSQHNRHWTKEELDKLKWLVQKDGPGAWESKAAALGTNRTGAAVAQKYYAEIKTPSSHVNDEPALALEPPPETGMSQQPKRNWTKEEIEKLNSLVEAEGPGMWAQKAASLGNAASLCLSALLCALTTHAGCRNRANGGCAPIALAG